MQTNQISEEDRQRISHLRKLVLPYLTDYYDFDFNFLRWLQGHSDPIDVIAEKLKNHLKARSSLWRMDKLGTMSRDKDIHKHWPYRITGLSGKLENVPVIIEQTAQIDFVGMLKTYSPTDILLARMTHLENMLYTVMEIEKKTGKQAYILYVIDLTELKYEMGIFRMILGPLKCLADFMADHYVELIKYVLIVNAPPFMSKVWNFAKPLMPTRTREKARLLSPSKWREEILEFANADALPDKWNTPDGPQFTSFIPLPIPFRKNDYYDCNELPEKLDVVHIPAGRSIFITRYADVGEQISWIIVADSHFAFAIYRADQEDEDDPTTMETVYPSFGWLPGPTAVPIKETHTIQKNGFYKLHLMNSRAWFHTLRVSYCFNFFPMDRENPHV
ncbi:CRAL-TRIO domain-containing protein F28H7.8 [Toxocara canis]|uniref:CRAL-TRIO domain-containing protein F28H7.8 n=1 Tax=Toxocara canis TaxID=6265 RepID=A0A0B2VIC1_TOXCA|nr:CRAL-TRIO domain-containing protein F28H7.8 [Toxocara canis]